jgi:hypothetical protein
MMKKAMRTLMAVAALAPAIGNANAQNAQVRANAMWFSSATALDAWQRDKAHLSSKALKAHQDSLLNSREAWQFIYRQPVTILLNEAELHELEVQMIGPGRLQGSVWWIDSRDLIR